MSHLVIGFYHPVNRSAVASGRLREGTKRSGNKDWKVGRKAVGKTGREVEKKAARWTTGRKEDKPKGRLESRKEG